MYNTDLPRRADLPTTAQLARSTIIAVILAAAILVTIVLPSEYGIDPTGLGRVLGLTAMGEIKVQLAQEAAADANPTTASAKDVAAPVASVSAADNVASQPPDLVGALLAQDTPATVPPARLGPSIEPMPTDRFAWAEPPTDNPEILKPAAPTSHEAVPQIGNAELATPQVPIPEPRPVPEAAVPPAPVTEPVVSAQATAEVAAAGRSDEVTFTLTPGQGVEIKLVMREGARANFVWSSLGGPINFDTHGDGSGQKVSYEKGRGVDGDAGILEAAFDGNHGWFWRNRGRNDVSVTLRTSGDYVDIKRVL